MLLKYWKMSLLFGACILFIGGFLVELSEKLSKNTTPPAKVPVVPPAPPPAGAAAPTATGLPEWMPSWLFIEDRGIPRWALILSVLVVVALLIFLKKMRLKYFATAIALSVFFAVLALYTNDALGVGARRGLLYFVAAAASLGLWAVEEKKLAFFFSVATFTILGISHFWTAGEVKNYVLAKLNSPPSYSAAPTVTSSGCDEVLRGPFSIGPTPQYIQPDGKRCHSIFDVRSGEVLFEGPGGYMRLGLHGVILEQRTSPGWRVFTYRSLGSSAVITRRDCPEGTTQWNGNRCV